MANEIIAFLGNGFDLSLGLKTSYGDFINKCWTSFNGIPDIGLKAFLSNKCKEGTWFDLEKAISDYVYNLVTNTQYIDKDIAEADINFHAKLAETLGDYLRSIQNSIFHYGNSIAEDILKAISANIINYTFTFNYTDLYTLAEKMNIQISRVKYKQLHGDTYNPILGIKDFTDNSKSIKIPKPYCKWIKSWHINYAPHVVLERLFNAKEIIFYGLSFGVIDYIYFRDYFNYICSKEIGDSKRIIIDIITKDYESQIDIYLQLREMGIDINTLMSKCELNIIRCGKNNSLDSLSCDNLEKLRHRIDCLSLENLSSVLGNN